MITRLLFLGACSEHTTGSGSIPSLIVDEPPTFRLEWETSVGDALDQPLRWVDSALMAGENCAPSFNINADAQPDGTRVNLFLPSPLAGGVVGSLPDAEFQGLLGPLMVGYVDFGGGSFTVEHAGPDGWTFVFEGPGLAACEDLDDPCEPLDSATLTLEPIDPADQMPEPWDKCYAGEPFDWADGWDGCANYEDSGWHTGTCPDPMPW